LIAISQNGSYFQYLIWVPAERGPLIIKFGEIKSPSQFNFRDGHFTSILEQITNEVPEISPRFQLSLDYKNVLISNTNYNSEEFLEWQNIQVIDPGFELLYHTFSYPFLNSSKLLNIHLNKELKSSIINSIQDVNGELRSINIGIFSAEIGARKWFYASQLESYAVWKMGKNNIDQLLIVKGGEFQSLITFKRLKNSIKVLNIIGSNQLIDKIIGQIEVWINDDLNEFIHIERVFAYSSEMNPKALKELIESEINNVTLLNPFEMLDISSEVKISPIKGARFAEVGIGFRGIDV
jgi:hypothetical protein